jgi:4-amino-4-deoxychorismate lyase
VIRRTWVNGVEQNTISASDRGLQFGDGLFETMALIGGKVRHVERHLDRLTLGCGRLGIPCPRRAELLDEFSRFAGAEGRAVLKLVLTRGVSERGYRIPESLQPTRILSHNDRPNYPAEWWEQGVKVRWCKTTLSGQPALAGLKHLNRLEQVLARREWSDPDIAEGLMCDRRGYLIGGTMTNVFLVRGKTLTTPRVDECGVAGTMRTTILELANALGLEGAVQEIAGVDVAKAEEMFLTNALIGAWPVHQLGELRLPRSTVTRQVQSLLASSSPNRFRA